MCAVHSHLRPKLQYENGKKRNFVEAWHCLIQVIKVTIIRDKPSWELFQCCARKAFDLCGFFLQTHNPNLVMIKVPEKSQYWSTEYQINFKVTKNKETMRNFLSQEEPKEKWWLKITSLDGILEFKEKKKKDIREKLRKSE